MRTNNQYFETVVSILGLENNSPCLSYAQYSNGLWELKIRTLQLEYDVFYDAETGELPGVSFEPITGIEYGKSYSFESLRKAS